jgi:uncharacterized protein (DUF1697 family)
VTHVALLRGINVGGKNILPMKDLAAIFEAAGCANVRTYIQSGNVVFSAPAGVLRKLPEQIAKAIEKRFGFKSPVILRSSDDLARTIRENPFLKTGAKGTSANETNVDEKWLSVYFLAALPEPKAVSDLDPNRSAPDVFHVREREIYLHLPNGMGRSKLTNAYFDSKLKTISTARNWATICKLLAMMEE